MAIGMLKTFGSAPQQGTIKDGSKNGLTHTAQKPTSTAEAFSNIYESRQRNLDNKKEQQRASSGVSGLWEKYMAGDSAAGGAIIKELEPTIKAAINNIVGGDQRYLTRARLMTLEALKGYDPNQGTALSSYVYNRLQGLRRLAADRGNFIHVPEKSALERKQLEAIKRDYMLEHGAEPSLAMLADLSGMPIKKVGRLTSIYGTTSESATRGESGDALAAQRRTATELYNDTFYTELPEIDKKIYEWSTGYQGAPQLDRATMAKKLGISEAAVSQHATKINKMAAKFDREVTRNIYGNA